MANMIEVIDALERCKPYCMCDDEGCPYYPTVGCIEVVRKDALELLKEQDRLLHKKQKDIDKLCADISDLRHRFHEKTEIVRCKDCKHFGRYYGDSKKGVCEKLNIIGRPEEWFCADGERKEW